MWPTPSWKAIGRFPVVAGTAALAIGVTCAWWLKADISPFFATAEIRRGQLWRLATSSLPHVDILHLIFNIYWLWVFGATVEKVYGHAKTALLLLLFAVGSCAFDFALDRGGVGLSGVGYGLFGLLWILSRRDPRFHDAMDQRTVTLFVGWFFFCILTTVTHVSPVANVAHAAGAVLGVLTGIAITATRMRVLHGAAVAAFVLIGLWGATLGRPLVNVSGKAGYEEGQWGYKALLADRNQEAVRWLKDAVKLQPQIANYWFNLGIAYDRIGDLAAARAAYQRAHTLSPRDPTFSVPDEN